MEPTETKRNPDFKFLIYGAHGWIGSQLVQWLGGESVVCGVARIENRTDVCEELDRVQPTHVLMAAGITGRPTVDWCESHKLETIRTNVIGTLNVIDCCAMRQIHITNFATGCIFEYDEAHPIGGPGFKETDTPNFHGSFYSHSKALVEDLLHNYDNCLTLRIRMPISEELTSRNFITKILNYDKVVDVPNSMTVLPTLLPLAIQAAKRGITGILNFCNPGVVSHNEVLQMYKDNIDPSFTWTNFSVEECEATLQCRRSNNALDTSRLEALFPDVPTIKDALMYVFEEMGTSILSAGVTGRSSRTNILSVGKQRLTDLAQWQFPKPKQ